MKYIFVAGAPGSKWSSVVKNIYYSPDIDRSDYRDDWTYYHDASGKLELMHLGAYFDPGMACPLPEYLSTMSKEQAEASFNSPFAADARGIRIIKSHIFCYEENISALALSEQTKYEMEKLIFSANRYTDLKNAFRDFHYIFQGGLII